MDSRIAKLRVTEGNEGSVRAAGDYVLYWMTGFRRIGFNFSLQRAVEWAGELGRPLVVLEALRCDYPWASDRLHRFVLDGMVANARRLGETTVTYYAYVEGRRAEGRGLLEALASRANVVVTDDYPAFFVPRMVTAASDRLPVRLEKVDSNGLLPLRAAERVFQTAHSFRRFLQRNFVEHLSEGPRPDPLKGVQLPPLDALPADIVVRWPNSAASLLNDPLPSVARLPIDHSVPAADASGGEGAASAVLERFLVERLSSYAEERNHPDEGATSGLSPYLHFGHISSHQVFSELTAREDWDTDRLAGAADGKRSGWWGLSESAEALLDQLITWRELGFNMSARRDDYERYESLPAWAQKTLAEHADDPRPYVYTLEELEGAATHDRIWNAAQTELLLEGRLHNYMRMLWGKKILEWSPTPQDALRVMIELNNKYALDGRDPNSYSGIFWCLGRYDRPWGPERPIFGKVRYMSSENTARKLRLAAYLERYAP